MEKQSFTGHIKVVDKGTNIHSQEDVLLEKDNWNDYGYYGQFRVLNSMDVFGIDFTYIHISDINGQLPSINPLTNELEINSAHFSYFAPDFYELLNTLTEDEYSKILSFMKSVNVLTDLNSFRRIYTQSIERQTKLSNGKRINFFSNALFRDKSIPDDLDTEESFRNFIELQPELSSNWLRNNVENTEEKSEVTHNDDFSPQYFREKLLSIARTYTTFISSTYTDLKAERQMVIQASLKSGSLPINMESFNPTFQDKTDVILPKIQDADFYILILGARYGKLMTDGSGISFTEWEFDQAQSLNKPSLVIILSEAYLNSVTAKVITATQFETQNPKYQAFREKLENKYVRIVDTEDDLKSAVETGLSELIKQAQNSEEAGLVSLKTILGML